MNVTFHTLSGLSTATFLASRMSGESDDTWFGKDPGLLAAGFLGNVLLHGLLDVVKHTYPLPAVTDVLISVALFTLALVFVRQRYWLVYGLSFLGSVFPDLIDLGPHLVSIAFRLNWPQVEIFPWHWGKYSGSVYDGSELLLSAVNHGLVLVAALALILACGKERLATIIRRRR